MSKRTLTENESRATSQQLDARLVHIRVDKFLAILEDTKRSMVHHIGSLGYSRYVTKKCHTILYLSYSGRANHDVEKRERWINRFRGL